MIVNSDFSPLLEITRENYKDCSFLKMYDIVYGATLTQQRENLCGVYFAVLSNIIRDLKEPAKIREWVDEINCLFMFPIRFGLFSAY